MKIIQLFIFCLFLSCSNKEGENFNIELGDILFQDLDSSPLCDAIEKVTPGYNNYNFSHIGIVTEIGKNIMILEAIPDKVKVTKLDSFLNRSLDSNNQPKVVVGRLKKEHKHAINDAILFLKSKIGAEYDHHFLENNNKYYCSELIYEAFQKHNIFKIMPMTFKDPDTRETMSIWTEYYDKLNISVPEAKNGINPGLMSVSKKIEIVHEFGKPTVKQK